MKRPTPLDNATVNRLRAVRSRDTGAELAARAVATALGARYRLHNSDLPGSPDLANRAKRWAIFVHGCFWHNHSGCERAMIPKNNRAYWHHKFALNKARDTKAQVALRKAGYRTLVVWECELAAGRALRRFASFLAQSNSDLFRDRARKLRRY